MNGDEQQRHRRQPVDVAADPELSRPTRPRPVADDRRDLLAVAGVDVVDPLLRRAGRRSRTRRACWRSRTRCRRGMRLPNRMMSEEGDAWDQRDQRRGLRNQPAASTVCSDVSCASSISALHLRQLVERDRAPVAVHHQHDRQADADLGGGDGDHEQGEDVPVDVLSPRERDEVEVDRVEHELDGHQHDHRVVRSDRAVDADVEQDGTSSRSRTCTCAGRVLLGEARWR